MHSILTIVGKGVSKTSKLLRRGHGSTWPGHIALSANKHFIRDVLRHSKTKIVLIAGTNGKTTTGKMLQTILEAQGKKVFQNESGANLLNGIASSIILNTNTLGKLDKDVAIFEIDENNLPLFLEYITPDVIILLNLFRDQLDRYGEVDSIGKKWKDTLEKLPKTTTLILNADDPGIAFIGFHRHPGESKATDRISTRKDSIASSSISLQNDNIVYFGLNDAKFQTKEPQHAVDSTYCPNCGSKLTYKEIYFSHVGNWTCPKCQYKRPDLDISKTTNYPLSGVYNRYNTIAAVLAAKVFDIDDQTIDKALSNFKPAFGRQEELTIDGKKVKIFLSKNPTSFNQSLRTIMEQHPPTILFVLNDRIPDGRDVSWIWDTDIEEFIGKTDMNIIISGDRAFDMGLRIKYALENQKLKIKNQNYSEKLKICENLKEAIKESLKSVSSNETLYILPTYSAMLEVRKILTGKKIL